MNFLHTAYFKKTTAVIFIALFVFIHAVKAFHTHDFSATALNKAAGKNATTLKADFFCSICDFQIAKDSDAAINSLHILTPVRFVTIHYNYILPVINFFTIVSSGRGPPSLA